MYYYHKKSLWPQLLFIVALLARHVGGLMWSHFFRLGKNTEIVLEYL